MSIEEDKKRYMDAMHGMQTGVAYLMNLDPDLVSPKHLRVGVNSALMNCGAIAKLLMDKGVITQEEYFRTLADAAEEERLNYIQEIRNCYPDVEIDLR